MQEKKLDERADNVHGLVKGADAMFRRWKVDPTPPPVPRAAPTPASAPPARRRFVPIDAYKPTTLSIETSYEDWLDFKNRFKIWGRACYKSVNLEDIKYEEWSSLLLSAVDTEWSKRVDFEAYNSIEELIGQIDAEIQLLRPLHLRRMNLIKITHSKGETRFNLLRRFMEGAKVSDPPTLSPQGILLQLFLDKCPERDDTRYIKTRH